MHLERQEGRFGFDPRFLAEVSARVAKGGFLAGERVSPYESQKILTPEDEAMWRAVENGTVDRKELEEYTARALLQNGPADKWRNIFLAVLNANALRAHEKRGEEEGQEP
jgi:hypothetical protein